MNLVTQFFAQRRDRLLMRLGCWLVCFSLIIGLMLPQQRAYAVEPLTMTAVASLAAAYLCACGMSFVTQGMDKDALVSSVQRLIQEFLDTELGGISIQDWLGNAWNLTVIAGKLIMGRPLTDEMMGFAQWVAGKYAAEVGLNEIYSSKYDFTLANGQEIVFGSYSNTGSIFLPDNATVFSFDTMYELRSGKKFGVYKENSETYQHLFRDGSLSVEKVYSGYRPWVPTNADHYYLAIKQNSDILVATCANYQGSVMSFGYEWTKVFWGISVPLDLSIDRAPSMSYIPEGIEAEQGIALDVGAAATMDLDLILQDVLEKVIAGELTATMEAADEKEEEKPVAIPDVGELGLPSLGTALTARFPFSIPWDFFRAVQLLAAPPKAPRFEVDFMEPIEHRVGKWQGDTTIVLDFAEYAIIGQISRWTSTIGFCIMLAGATKRLIWTA